MRELWRSGDVVLDPIVPEPLVLLVAAALVLVTVRIYWRVGATLTGWRRAALLGFRLLGIGLILLLLLQPSAPEPLPPPAKKRVTLVAVDTSLSMKQRDVDRTARLDAAKKLLVEADVVAPDGLPGRNRVRLFEFSADAQPVQKSIHDLVPKGTTTRLNKSVQTMLGTGGAGESARALVLLSDGHDFELTNPVKTGAAAKAQQVPIYAVPLGQRGKVRDVSTRITSFQPYCYVKQKSRLTASLRLIGCEFEDLQVQLLRHGQVVQTRKINTEEAQEASVEFDVLEPEVGQYEYEVRAQPLERELDTANNSAITYLNVIDQQIRVLLLEGDPYWDTTFLQRSLMRNDKFLVDALIRYGKERVRAISSAEASAPLHAPRTPEEFDRYDAIILGRQVDLLLQTEQIQQLTQFVQERGGTVVFSRGRAFENAPAGAALEPVVWSDTARDRVRLDMTAEGRALSPTRSGQAEGSQSGSLPELVAGRSATQTEPLTATLATASSQDDKEPAPAIVHRRYGRGQVVSVGVEGLWRWGLSAQVEEANSPFDRFWDHLILWLLASRDFIPSRQFSFRPSSANIVLGEKVHFRMTMRQAARSVTSVPLTFYLGEREAGRATLTLSATDAGRLLGEFLPERVGRYRAVAKFPDGTTQESRFIVFTENLEETEVAVDLLYLRRLCESSGGRLIEPEELGRFVEELDHEKAETTVKTRLRPVWNSAWIFYLAGLLFGLDWLLRRRWGLC